MKCPFCNRLDDKVIDSRTAREGEVIRRRRECFGCRRRFTTYERIEENLPTIVKKTTGEKRSIAPKSWPA